MTRAVHEMRTSINETSGPDTYCRINVVAQQLRLSRSSLGAALLVDHPVNHDAYVLCTAEAPLVPSLHNFTTFIVRLCEPGSKHVVLTASHSCQLYSKHLATHSSMFNPLSIRISRGTLGEIAREDFLVLANRKLK